LRRETVRYKRVAQSPKGGKKESLSGKGKKSSDGEGVNSDREHTEGGGPSKGGARIVSLLTQSIAIRKHREEKDS